MRASSFDNNIKHHDIKSEIVARSIAKDQQAVAEQWAKTFSTNANEDSATNMARLMLACVAKGDFFIKNAVPGNVSAGSDFAAKAFERPSDQLNAVDYISHASRIIIDFSGMSEQHRNAFLMAFDAKDVYMRASTHAINRGNAGIKEDKLHLLKAAYDGVKTVGVNMINAAGKWVNWDIQAEKYVAANHRGVNIAMGGENNNNYYDKPIHADGSNGHMYFYINAEQQLILCGLEQTAPHSNADQFGQTHSAGGSDVYTAAGSLYFSDPIYHAKLVSQCGVLPPAKYNGMLVKLTDDNWHNVYDFASKLGAGNNVAQLTQTLMETKPATCEAKEMSNQSFIDFDINNYMQRIYALFIKDNDFCKENSKTIEEIHKQLVALTVGVVYPDAKNIAAIKKAKADFQRNVKANNFGVIKYLSAIDTIIDVFEKERVRVNHYGDTAEMALHHRNMTRIALVQVELVEIYNRIPEILAYYQNSFIDPQDAVVAQYVADLQKLAQTIHNSCEELKSEGDAAEGFAMMDSISADKKLVATLPQFEALLTSGNELLNQFPRLVAADAQKHEDTQKLKQVVQENQVRFAEMRANLEQISKLADQLKADLAQAIADKNSAEAGLEKYKVAAKDAVAQANYAKTSVKDLEAKLQNQQAISDKLSATVRSKEAEIDSLDQRLEAVGAELRSANSSADVLRQQLAAAEQQAEVLRQTNTEIEGLRQQLAAAHQQIEALRVTNAEIDGLRQQLEEIRREKAELDRQVAANAVTISELQAARQRQENEVPLVSGEPVVQNQQAKMHRVLETTGIQIAITQLKVRAGELRQKGNIPAATEGDNLVTAMQSALETYIHSNKSDVAAKSDLKVIFDSALHPNNLTNLYKDPTSAIIVKNVLLAVFTFGFGLIAMAINKGVTGNFGFFTKTDGESSHKTFSINKEARRIGKAVEKVAPAPVAVEEAPSRKRLRRV